MAFKDNLKKKINIDKMALQVIGSLKPIDNTPKVDKDTMKQLLEFSFYTYRRERDLDLYIKPDESGIENILVLDNELTIYRTTVEDVALRKSPTIKEMLSIRNAIKILNDADVIVSKKENSIQTIHQECIALLDLSFEKSDIEAIKTDGVNAFKIGDPEGVIECLSLFAELLDYASAPKSLEVSHHKIIGPSVKKSNGKILFGPMVVYNISDNIIKLIDETLDLSDKEQKEYILKIITGDQKATTEGTDVFQYLKDAVIRLKA